MVSLTAVRASNACIPNTLPSGLVAVFVGGTSGIGEYTLKEFARFARQPRIYNIGRSREASDRIAAECKKLNADAQYTFIQADVSLIRRVDAVCEQVQAKEKTVNILFLSAGTLATGVSMYYVMTYVFGRRIAWLTKVPETEEGLHLMASLKHHSRARFILNLLPLLKAATGIRRVVSVISGTKEGEIDLDDLQGWNVTTRDRIKHRGHSSSIVTLTHAHFMQQAPTVSFIHDYPGVVKSGIARGTTGLLWGVMTVIQMLGPLINIPEQESGERHLYFATSARFRAKDGVEEAVQLGEGVGFARGIDGVEGSGVYSADQDNESAGPAVEELLGRFKKEGLVEKVWGMIEEDFARITKLPRE
jgi:NAD(P)-dependent dehydrogenase (short-subunit alcohol dehydrogenase family)